MIEINSIQMQLQRIDPGTFVMGSIQAPLPVALTDDQPHRRHGDFDEHPAHKVTISQPFFMAAFEVTNAQYEQFAPGHHNLRGKVGFSKADDEAVVFVSWHDATRFCQWLSKKEERPYRLPTEAEWEYACRAGTDSPFHTGDMLPKAFQKNVMESWFVDPATSGGEEVVPLTVGQTPPNASGLYDMHGNVEEWCYDWYGPYEADDQVDPIGRADGDFRVTREGSHSTLIYYLRSANRMGMLPEDQHWLTGFRIVRGELPKTEPLPVPSPKRWSFEVKQEPPLETTENFASNPNEPYFKGPRKYVKIPPDSNGPLFSAHNHDPAIVACPNGDLLAIWYSCVTERGRELNVVGSRLRYGQEEWEPAAPFWGAPDRNNHASSLWCDEQETIHHFNGLSVAATWGPLAAVLRTSKDNGATWSKARLIMPEHTTRQMPVESVFHTQEGWILLPCDAVTGGSGGTTIWVSRDDGKSWVDPGGTIAGIHAAVVPLRNGDLMAFGRSDNIDGKMPKSISSDMGQSWRSTASVFPPISGGQRCVLLRLKEGQIFFASFTPRQDNQSVPITDESGKERLVTGLFSALSFNDGKSWSCVRPICDDGTGREVETMDGTPFTMSLSSAEPAGYLSVCQADDELIHLISSRQHYTFNLAWLKTPPPSRPRRAGMN